MHSLQSLRRGYTGYRPDVLALIRNPPSRVLDVGCGAGMLGRDIKERWPQAVVVGIDRDPCLVEEAAKHLDRVVLANIEDDLEFSELGNEQFDAIIFADLLEHLISPERVLRVATRFLAPGGFIVTSIPNVRHYSTILSLVFLGKWPQRDRGIHDRTHLRFFSRRDILHLLRSCGLEPLEERRNVRLIEPWSWTNIPGKLFDFWPFRPFLTYQYLHRSTLSNDAKG